MTDITNYSFDRMAKINRRTPQESYVFRNIVDHKSDCKAARFLLQSKMESLCLQILYKRHV